MNQNRDRRITYIVTMDCLHTRIYEDPPPQKGEELWCLRCDVVRHVIAAPPEIRVRCQQCSFARAFGRARVNAEIGASKHRIKHPTHTVLMFDGKTVLRRFEDRYTPVISPSSDGDQQPMF